MAGLGVENKFLYLHSCSALLLGVVSDYVALETKLCFVNVQVRDLLLTTT